MIEQFDIATQETLLELEKTQRQFWNISRVTGEFLNLLIRTAKSKIYWNLALQTDIQGYGLQKRLKKQAESLRQLNFTKNESNPPVKTLKNAGFWISLQR